MKLNPLIQLRHNLEKSGIDFKYLSVSLCCNCIAELEQFLSNSFLEESKSETIILGLTIYCHPKCFLCRT